MKIELNKNGFAQAYFDFDGATFKEISKVEPRRQRGGHYGSSTRLGLCARLLDDLSADEFRPRFKS